MARRTDPAILTITAPDYTFLVEKLMAQAILSVSMDESLKKNFASLCNEFGMNTTTAITVFAEAVVQQRKLPFEIGIAQDPFWSESNQKHLRKAVADINAGKYTVHDLIEDDDD
jgi:DNA-damage-inducible protein J